MRLSNLSAEAEALAAKLPAALPAWDDGVELDILGVHHAEGVKEMGRRTGVNETRREELHGFLKERFAINLEIADKIARGAQHNKEDFLSEPVMEVIHKMYKIDYDLLGEYF
eukprot:jgi/Undpi1/5151/HiC_scaffold_19.g08502.m1